MVACLQSNQSISIHGLERRISTRLLLTERDGRLNRYGVPSTAVIVIHCRFVGTKHEIPQENGSQFNMTSEYRSQSVEETRPVT